MIKKWIFAFLFIPCITLAQNFDLGSWNIVNLKYNIDKKWSVFGEAQIRSLQFYASFHYHEVKGGLNYKPLENLTLTFAGGNYQTYSEKGNFSLPKNNNEIRLWPQITLNQKLGQLKIEHRYRAELRFTSNGYKNRFRYRLGLMFPILKNKTKESTLYYSVNNEIFFTDNEPFFERNRFYTGFQYQYSKKSTFQIGYIHQFDYKINDETGRDFLVLGYYITIK